MGVRSGSAITSISGMATITAISKLKGDNGNLYILRLDENELEWELIMFQRRDLEEARAEWLSKNRA